MKNSVLLALFGLVAIAAIPASASTATFQFSSNASDQTGAYGSTFTLAPNSGSITGLTNVVVSAYNTNTTTVSSTTPTSTAIVTSELDNWNGYGLGVCSQKEGLNCGSPQHQVDNANGTYEFVVFKFATAVSLSSITLYDYAGTSMDISYWAGSTTPTFTTVATLTGIGTKQNDLCSTNCGSGNSITDSLTGNNVNYLVVAALFDGTSQDDTFKIESLVVNSSSVTPEPATFGMFGLAIAGLGFMARKRKQS